jgi:bifunctional non-homologous end joining protein LigD
MARHRPIFNRCRSLTDRDDILDLSPSITDETRLFRSTDVKTTCAQRETLTIAGFALDGNDWDGIYLGRRKGDDLIYAGKVDHGFDKQSSAELRKRLTPLIRKSQPYTKRIAHKGIWVEPELLAEIEYRAKSAEGKVRHPFFKGLREDL